MYNCLKQNNFVKVQRIKITSKRDSQTTPIFKTSKTYLQGALKWPWFFVFQKHIKRSTLMLRRFFIRQNYIEKSTSDWRRLFPHQNYSIKARRNDVEIRQYWSVDVYSTCWVCWYNVRTKLLFVSTQNVVVSTLNFDVVLVLIK